MAKTIAELCQRPQHRLYNTDGTPRAHQAGDKPLSYQAVGGPLAGAALPLWTARTLAFRLRGEHGYYVLRAGSRRFLQWVKLDARRLRVIQ